MTCHGPPVLFQRAIVGEAKVLEVLPEIWNMDAPYRQR